MNMLILQEAISVLELSKIISVEPINKISLIQYYGKDNHL